MLTHLDLFSGIGGFALACQWAGIETIGFIEIDKYCQKVLKKHWPNVPIVEDIRDVEKIKEIVAHTNEGGYAPSTRETIPEGESASKPNSQSRCRSKTRNTICRTSSKQGNKKPTILITAGFPCQPFSVAGKRGGSEDDRYLWPQTLAVIEAIKPKWVLLENVTGIINLALDTVLSDLEGAGYAYETLVIPACAVNAWHRRDRVWIVAWNTKSDRSYQERGFQEGREGSGRGSKEVVVADSRSPESGGLSDKQWQENTEIRHSDWWAVEPRLGSMANGIPPELDGYFDTEPDIPRLAKGIKNRQARLKCQGNAIVPQVAYQILKIISKMES